MGAYNSGMIGAMRRWFKENPGEYMTYPDMMTKFGIKSEKTAKQMIYWLKLEGVVVSERVVYADPERPR